MQPFSKHGLWRLSDDEACKCPGVLTFKPHEGLTLDLIGTREEVPDVRRIQSGPPEVAFGVTDGNEQTTLFRGTWRRADLRSSDAPSSVALSFDVCFIGTEHITDPDTQLFTQLELHLPSLGTWADIEGVTVSSQDTDGWTLAVTGGTSTGLNTRVQDARVEVRRELALSRTGGGETREIGSLEMPTPVKNTRRFDIEDRVWFRARVDPGLTYGDWDRRFVRPLQDLLTLAGGEPCGVREVHLEADAPAEPDNTSTGQWVGMPIIVSAFGRQTWPSAEDLGVFGPDSRHKPLFCRSHLPGGFDVGLPKWLNAVVDEISMPASHYFNVQYHPDMPIEIRFLNMVAAVEGYWRERHARKLVRRCEHEKAVKTLIGALPGGNEYEDYNKSITDRLGGANSPDLRMQIVEALNMHDESMRALVSDFRKFAADVVSERNALAHGGTRKTALSQIQYATMLATLTLLMQCFLMTELGFDPSACATRLKNTIPYVSATRLAAKATEVQTSST